MMPYTIWNIPTGLPFLKTLAQGLPNFCKTHHIDLGDIILYLPYARAGAVFQQLLLEGIPKQASFLPTIRTLGDIQEDIESSFEVQMEGGLKPVPPLVRRGLLAQLVREKQTQLALQEGVDLPPFEMTLELVEGLIALLDQACIENVDLNRLDQLVPESFAGHWQATLDFMRIIQVYWPKLLEEKGYEEPYQTHQRLVQQKVAHWTQQPPSGWVLAAGSTGTMPATAQLLKTIATLPQGGVILPGLDTTLRDDTLERLSACHPQYAMQQLLKQFKIHHTTIPNWPWIRETKLSKAQKRQQLTSQIFQDTFSNVETSKEPLEIHDIHYLPCHTLQEEAETLAVILRESLELPNQTAALISADQNLLDSVFYALKRWHIVPHNSAGRTLGQTKLGTFLPLMLRMVLEKAKPVALLSFLKHPLCCLKDENFHKRFCSLLEDSLLRGMDPGEGLEGLQKRSQLLETSTQKILKEGLELLGTWVKPLQILALESKVWPFQDWVEALCQTLPTLLNPSPCQQETQVISALTSFLEASKMAAPSFPALGAQDALTTLETLLKTIPLPPEPPTHPQIQLLGTLEARLLDADRVILGGLNEGSWPPTPSSGPWLNRPMRQDIGLPPLERRIGLSAHDFCQAFSSKMVILTRALRVGGTLTFPSRFLARLETLLHAKDVTWAIPPAWQAWTQSLDAPKTTLTASIPAPRPPVWARPRTLSVTQIEMWRKDPYAFYAKHILKLRPLDPLEAEPDHALQGTVVHHVFDLFLKHCPDLFSNDALDHLMALGKEKLSPFFHQASVGTFWLQRFHNMATWFLETERKRRHNHPFYKSLTEVEGQLILHVPQGAFHLKARADRIDAYRDGRVDLIDYKTGSPPSETDVVCGNAPQLPLEAAILKTGGFAELGNTVTYPGTLSFWHVSGRNAGGEIKTLKTNSQTLADEALEGLTRLVQTFDDPDQPYYPQSDLSKQLAYPDYGHLARYLAWSGR